MSTKPFVVTRISDPSQKDIIVAQSKSAVSKALLADFRIEPATPMEIIAFVESGKKPRTLEEAPATPAASDTPGAAASTGDDAGQQLHDPLPETGDQPAGTNQA